MTKKHNFSYHIDAMVNAGAAFANSINKYPPDSVIRAESLVAYRHWCTAKDYEFLESELGTTYRCFKDGINRVFGDPDEDVIEHGEDDYDPEQEW